MPTRSPACSTSPRCTASSTSTGPTSRPRPGPRSCRSGSCRPTTTSRPTCSPRSGRATSSSTTRTSRSPPPSERFITQAADDPDVLTIKMTLYRTSGDSPIVQSLIRAAERGKQVVVLVEIKARFDEEANIIWARKLERAGAHVVYGLVGLKTHSKTALVVRREGTGLRRYVHIGTGNYNPKTARLYVDLGLLTIRPEIGADVTDLFNVLTGLSRQRTFRRLLVAPHSLRAGFLDLLTREVAHAAAGRPASVVVKTNAVVDIPVIEALYSTAAGRRRHRSHRPWRVLAPAGSARHLRADPRPLDHRRIPRALADLALRERRRSAVVHRLGRPDGPQPRPAGRGDGPRRGQRGQDAPPGDHRHHARRRPPLVAAHCRTRPGYAPRSSRAVPGTIDTFEILKEQALESGLVTTVAHRPGAGAGSLDPRA